jgi:hypothetical protein
MRTRILAVLATLLLFTASAQADTKSWAAVKAKLPAGTQIVVGIDVTALAKTTVYAQVIQKFLDEEKDAKQGFDAIKAGCGVDVTTAVTDATIVAMAEPKEQILVAIGLNGIDKDKVSSCMQTIIGGSGSTKLTAKTKGKVTEYSLAGKSEKLYIAWLAKDVIALTDDPTTKGKLEKMLAGKAAKGDLKKMIGKTTTTSPVWFAVAMKEKIDEINGTFKGAYGQADLAAGTFTGKANAVVGSADEATKVAAMGNAELAKATVEIAKILPDLATVLKTARITATGAEVNVTGTVTEKQILGLIPQLDKIK